MLNFMGYTLAPTTTNSNDSGIDDAERDMQLYTAISNITLSLNMCFDGTLTTDSALELANSVADLAPLISDGEQHNMCGYLFSKVNGCVKVEKIS